MVGLMSRSHLVKLVTFVSGLYFVLEFLLPESVLSTVGIVGVHDKISYGFITVGAVAFGLGIINLFSHHGRKILYRRDGAFFSTVLLCGLVATIVFGLLDWRASLSSEQWQAQTRMLSAFSSRIVADVSEPSVVGDNKVVPIPLTQRVQLLASGVDEVVVKGESLALSADETVMFAGLKRDATSLKETPDQIVDPVFREPFLQRLEKAGAALAVYARIDYEKGIIRNLNLLLVEGLFNSLGAAMFSLLAIYIATAAFRAFRVKSVESFLMMIAAVLVILGQTFVGALIAPEFSVIRQWLLEVPNSAAFRAIKFGAAIAGLVMAVRMWLSIESGSFVAKQGRR